MSGICGVWALDGDWEAAGAIAAMTDRLERRGPDATHRWEEGPIAFGHTLLATTPEALTEQLPLTDEATGCTITADARLDNRDALLAALQIDGGSRTIGDGELILRCYLEWGADCPVHLLGDFAFAIWDPREASMFCARDQMGMRQLIYHHRPGRLFAFATHAEAILALNGVPKRLNEGRIADFLDNLEAIDRTSTFFEDVFRLPAAHTLIVDASNGPALRSYWKLEPGAELNLPSKQAYAEAFLEVFTEAVRCRLRSPAPVGSMLSGGVDSGSVVAIAARLLAEQRRGPLVTFSAIGAGLEDCPETRSIRSTAAIPGLDPHLISQDGIAEDCESLAILPDGTEPFDSNMTLVRAVYLAAERAKIRVMLDGAGGDVVLTCGNRVAQLLGQGRLIAAVQEARGEQRFWGPTLPAWKILVRSAWTAFVPWPIRVVRQDWIARRSDRRIGFDHMIAPDFAERVDLPSRRKRYRRNLPPASRSVPWQRAAAMVHPHMVVARERYDRIASAMAIEPRDPFMDVRVVTFCLSLPAEQLQAQGWPKMILRRAMRDLLPPDVIWRRGKEHLGWRFTQTLFSASANWIDQLWQRRPDIERYLTSDAMALRNQGLAGALGRDRKIELFFLAKWIAKARADFLG